MELTTEWTQISGSSVILQKHGHTAVALIYSATTPSSEAGNLFTLQEGVAVVFPHVSSELLWARAAQGTGELSITEFSSEGGSVGIIPGGLAGQILVKQSGIEGAYVWEDRNNLRDDLGTYSIAVNPVNGNLEFSNTISGVTEFVGEAGGGYTDQLVFTKPLGGVRFQDQGGFEYFAVRRDVSGDTLGAVFGNLDTTSGNFLATSEAGGITVCAKTDVDLQQQIGNPASTAYIEGTLFSFPVTSDQVKPYGGLFQGFTAGFTDVDFVDVPFDTRILNSSGTVVYSDIQPIAIFQADPGASKFKLSSTAGVVNLPPSQPFPMDSGDTYTVEYEFATPIRLKGDGAIPSLTMNSKRLEYYPLDYQAFVEVDTADFVATSGSHYKVDTTGGTVTATVHPTVKSVEVGDFGLTWTNANPFILSTSVGDLTFGTSEKGKLFEVIKYGASYRVYNADGSFHSETP